jgi:dihydroxyacetone kinase-like protein
MDVQLKKKLIDEVAKVVFEHFQELTELDQAIGDGDHGLNMKRGFSAVMEGLDAELDKSFPDLLRYVGTTLVMKVGGASGPLYGTLFMTLGKELSEDDDLRGLSRALGVAIEAVQKRGKSEPGQKTLLDVLSPVHKELEVPGGDLFERVKNRAHSSAKATIPMLAIRGRASFLGERSIGHMDPGARSCSLMIGKICEVIGG